MYQRKIFYSLDNFNGNETIMKYFEEKLEETENMINSHKKQLLPLSELETNYLSSNYAVNGHKVDGVYNALTNFCLCYLAAQKEDDYLVAQKAISQFYQTVRFQKPISFELTATEKKYLIQANIVKYAFIGFIIIVVLCLLIPVFSSISNDSKNNKCTICGKPGKQITNSAGDYAYYCNEHYPDAWNHYYGN